jgi:penicillin-binding protein 1A
LKLPLALLVWLPIAAPIVSALVVVGVVRHHAEGLPAAPNLERWLAQAPQSNVIVAADGSLLAELPFRTERTSGHRWAVSYPEIPVVLVQAVLAAEDLRFFQHKGIDTRAVVRSAWANYRAKKIVQGASTIPQQLARNLIPDIGKERSLRRKIREALVARRIEAHHSKEEIFAAYANYVFLGANAYGVKAAARAYFDKALVELNVAESAMIAGLIQIPGRGDPYKNPETARERRNVILERMLRAQMINESDYNKARESALGLRAPPEFYGNIAPWITEEARRLTRKQFPYLYANGGLVIETTALPGLSEQAQNSAQEHSLSLQDAKAPQIGVLVFDHFTGYVELMVGGISWQDNQFNRATQACRQPGSAFKPLVYGAALESDAITPATALRDGPISEYDPKLEVYWKPTNSGREFRGIAIAQDAMALSLNTPAVDVFDRVGGEKVIEFAKRLGIDSPLRNLRPLALGASCVVPILLTKSYGIIARGGSLVEPRVVKRVVARGQVLVDDSAHVDPFLTTSHRLDRISFVAANRQERVLDEGTAFQLRSMLRSVVTSGTARAARNMPIEVGGKTGTTNNNTDAWFVGFSSRVAAAVWIGHDNPEEGLGRQQDGGRAALPLWIELVGLVESVGERRAQEASGVPGLPPEGLEVHRIDRDSGLLAQPGAGGSVDLHFRPGTAPTEHAGGLNQRDSDWIRRTGTF